MNVLVVFFCPGIFAEDKWLADDKLKHFGVSAFLTVFSYNVSHHHFEMSDDDALKFSAGFTFAIGGLKEIRDSSLPGETSSAKDLIADILGIAAGIFIATR